MDLSKTSKITKTVKGEVSGEPFTVTYKPNVLTMGEWYRLQQLQESPTPEDSFISQYLQKVVDSWDLTFDGKKAVPLSREGLAEVPMSILGAILTAITEDLLPNERRATSSN